MRRSTIMSAWQPAGWRGAWVYDDRGNAAHVQERTFSALLSDGVLEIDDVPGASARECYYRRAGTTAHAPDAFTPAVPGAADEEG